jgi:N-acetylglucosamine-6-sulfatase
VRSELIDKGSSFENAFISDPLCCPSRSTILTGLYAHNHGVKSNNPPNGGFLKFVSEGLEQDTIATRLHQSGYETGLFGKYLNHYPGDDLTHVPAGWDDWHAWGDTWGESESEKKSAKKGNTEGSAEGGQGGEGESGAEYYGYKLNENGQSVSYGNSSEDYITDVLSSKATDFVQHATSDSKPFFWYFAPTAPHGPRLPRSATRTHSPVRRPLALPPSTSRTSRTNRPGSGL